MWAPAVVESPSAAAERRAALVELENVVRPIQRKRGRKGPVCMAIIGRRAGSGEFEWGNYRWSGCETGLVHCGLPATVDVGYNACTEHGWREHAYMLRHQLLRIGIDIDEDLAVSA